MSPRTDRLDPLDPMDPIPHDARVCIHARPAQLGTVRGAPPDWPLGEQQRYVEWDDGSASAHHVLALAPAPDPGPGYVAAPADRVRPLRELRFGTVFRVAPTSAEVLWDLSETRWMPTVALRPALLGLEALLCEFERALRKRGVTRILISPGYAEPRSITVTARDHESSWDCFGSFLTELAR